MDIKKTYRIRLAAGIAINVTGLGIVLGQVAQQMAQHLPSTF